MRVLPDSASNVSAHQRRPPKRPRHRRWRPPNTPSRRPAIRPASTGDASRGVARRDGHRLLPARRHRPARHPLAASRTPPERPVSAPLGFKSQLLRLEIRPRTPTATAFISTCPRLDRNGGGRAPGLRQRPSRRPQDTAPGRATQEKTSNKNDTFSPPSPIARHRRAAIAKHRRRAETAAAAVPPRETSRPEKVP